MQIQRKTRFQVEMATKNGLVIRVNVLRLDWEKPYYMEWKKIEPESLLNSYELFGHHLSDLPYEDYLKLLKINFVQAFRYMNRSAVLLNDDLVGSGIRVVKTVGLNYVEYNYNELVKEELKCNT